MSCDDIIISETNETTIVSEPNETTVVSTEQVSSIVESTTPDILVETVEIVTIISEGTQGPPGRDGDVVAQHKELSFSYADIVNSLVIGGVVLNQKVQQTVIEIIEPFDNDLGITVGTNVSNAILMTIANNDPATEGTYTILNNLSPTPTDIFSAFFTYDTAPTTGSAIITIYYN